MDDVTRIRAAMVAFCAGDALGAPWEGAAPGDVRPEGVGLREGWPRGATSDDTDQLLLAAAVLCEDHGDVELERRFLDGLAGALPSMRGAGPTTTAAVARYRETGALRASGGATNGAAMRAPAAGWATARRDARARRRLALRLGHTTHAEPAALGAACVVAAMAAAGLEDRDPVAAAEREAKAGPVAVLAPVLAACAGGWAPPPAGVPLDAVPTAAAVVHVVRSQPRSLDEAVHAAVALGGDTDTVAALVGAVVGPRFAGDAPPPWLSEVVLPDGATLDALAAGLAARRRA